MGYFTINTNKVLGFSLSKLSVAFIGILSTSAYADEATGLAWLQAQSQDKVDSSTVASQLQSLSETSRTIHELANTPTSFDIKDLQKKKFSTESLVRFALINHFQKGDEATKTVLWSQLKDRQNDDGGFNHRKGWQSNPLDTAYLLLTLAETDYLANAPAQEKTEWQNKIVQALNYLISQQREDGSYQIIKLEKLYVSSYVLSTLSKYAQEYPQLVPSIQKLVTYLKNSQVQPAKWSNHPKGLFVDALVAESLHPYTNGDNSIQTAFKQRAMDAQQADGSWQDDMYVTAVVLDSLKKQSETVLSPVASNISLSVVDAETNLPISQAKLTSTTNSSPASVTITTDASGIANINNTPAGVYQFTLSRDGYNPINFEVNLKQGQKLTINPVLMSRDVATFTPQIQGAITDSQNGTGIANAQITITLLDNQGQPLSNQPTITTQTSDKGLYQAILPISANFKIEITKAGYVPIMGTGSVNSGSVTLYSRKMVNQDFFSAKVSGRVVDENNKPIQDVRIVNDNQVIATTDSDGVFYVTKPSYGKQTWQLKIADKVVGNLNLVIDKPISYGVGIITIPSDGSNPIALQTGELILKAVNIKNEPVYNYVVMAEKLTKDNKVEQTQYFLAQNTSNVTNLILPKGKWRVTGLHPAFTATPQTYEVSANNKVTANLNFGVKPYGIEATVVDSQTNKAIANSNFTITDSASKAVLHTGKTDANGKINITKKFTALNVELYINPTDYLDTKRYISVTQAEKGQIDLGEVRLRPKSAEVILPDLKITEIDSTKLTTDQQSLNISGSITAKVVNKGNTDVNQSVTLTAFEDKNYNKKLDKDEQILGTAKLTNSLAYQKDNADDTHAKVSINLTGKTQFREAPIAVMVDSDSQLAEKNEKNNIRYTSDTAEIKPKVGTLDAEVVWHWQSKNSKYYPDKNSVESSPMVSPLYDTNNDGRIDTNDDSYVIFISMGKWWLGGDSRGSVRIVNAKTGKEHLAFGVNDIIDPLTTPAIGDIDRDGYPDIIIKGGDNNVIVYNNDGSIKWRKKVPSHGWGTTPSLVDLDGDGKSEIVLGSTVLDYQGKVVYQDTNGRNGFEISVVAKLNGINNFIIGSKGIYDPVNQKVIKRFSLFQDGLPAVADFNKDGIPEIVYIYRNGNLVILDNKGDILVGPVKIPNTYIHGGPPTIADFDGDGTSDIGVAGTRSYSVIRSDGSVMWSKPSLEDQPDFSGSSIFDFNNDGKFEVVYGDLNSFKVMNGSDGETQLQIKTDSVTFSEYPVIVDADKDGHADILLASSGTNGGYYKGINGIRMISSKNKDWANTRSIWNQHSYHVTNINDDLSIPKNEPNSWEVHNTYRANLLLGQNATAASDLTTSYIRIKDNSIIGDSSFTARVGNAGGKPVAKGTPVSFYRVPKTNNGSTTAKPVLLGTVKLTKDLVGGNIAQSYEDVTLPFKGSLADFGEIVIVANDAGAGLDSATGIPVGQTADTTKVVQEYSRGNNTARLAVDGGFVALSLSGSLDNTKYTSNKEVSITAIPKNLGSFTSSPIVKIQILDDAGNVIATLPEQTVNLTSALIPDAGNSKTVVQKWNTGTNRVGNYTARITLWRKPLLSSVTGAEQELVATVNKPFSIVAGSDTGDGINTGIVATTQSNITTDKASYTANDLVTINSRIQNTTNNKMATKRDIIVEVKDSTGKTIFTQQYSYDELPPNALKDEPFQITLKDAKAGTYTVTQTTKAPDGSQGMQVNSTRFSVADSSQTGIGIAGTLTANKTQVELGDTVKLNWSINNTGDVALTKLPLKVALFKGNADKPFTTLAINPADINKGGSISQSVNWTAVGADKDQITAILVAGFKDDTGTVVDKGLAVTNFTLIEPQIEVAINPADTKHAEPLLVYYGCEEGWKTFYQNSSYGAFQFPCFNERANVLTGYLNRLQVPYKLVKRPEHFADQLQSGLYEQVWLLGAIEELRPHTRKELTELSHLGDNLVMDAGMNSWVNQDLYPLTGTKFKNRLLLKDGSMMLAPSFMSVIDRFSPDNTIANTPLVVSARSQAGHPFYSSWAVQLQPQAGSSVWANYQGQIKKILPSQQQKEPVQSFPAIISQRYGNGQPVALGFDLINSLKQASKANIINQHNWEATLKALLASRTVKAATDYVPQDVVHVPVQINNKGNRNKTIKVEIDLPTGANWLGTQGGINGNGTPYVQTGSTIRYEVAINGKQNLNQLLSIRLPNTAGAHAVRVTLSDAKGKQLAQQEMRYLVRDINSRFTAIHNTIKAWNVFGTNGLLKLNAKTNATNINTHLHTGVKQLAVYEASRLANKLRLMQEKDKSNELQQLRYEVDELLRALQIDWYVDRKGYVPLP